MCFHGNPKWLVTAGPTIENIDPVRFISNYSTGKMGYAIAAELAARGAEVLLVSGRTALPVPEGVRRVDVLSAEDMYRECAALWSGMDGAVMCAAVADYTPVQVSATKIKKSGKETGAEELTIKLRPTKDIAAELGRVKRAGQLLVGFALETDDEEANALGKMERKNLDMIVLNSLRDEGAGFGCDTNRITIFSRPTDGSRHGYEDCCGNGSGNSPDNAPAMCPTRTDFPLESKSAAAVHIVDSIERLFTSAHL